VRCGERRLVAAIVDGWSWVDVRNCVGTVVIVLLVFFVISQPGKAATSVRSIETSLAGSMVGFFTPYR
jgi:hypothetical protein